MNSCDLPLPTSREAIGLAQTLMGMFRKADYTDPAVFSTALCKVFSAYPLKFGREIVDPMEGLPSRLKFSPAISEVKEALDGAILRRSKLRAWTERTLSDRQQTALRDALSRKQEEDWEAAKKKREAQALRDQVEMPPAAETEEERRAKIKEWTDWANRTDKAGDA